MTKFGDWASNAATPIGEKHFQVSPRMNLTVAGENLFSMGSFTMPFAGHLHVELYAEASWPGDQAPGLWLSVGPTSTPSRNNTGDLGVCQPCAGLFNAQHELRTHAAWNNLGAGTVVTGIARIYSTVANVVYLAELGGFWRPMAS